MPVSKRTKTIVSVLGAAIVFATSVVKDEWRDHLRGIGGSIRDAENIFIIQADSLRLYWAIQDFEDNFVYFVKNPSEKRDLREGYSKLIVANNDSVNWKQLEEADVGGKSNAEVLDKLERLAETFPDKSGSYKLLQEVTTKNKDFLSDLNTCKEKAYTYRKTKALPGELLEFNTRVIKLSDQAFRLTQEVKRIRDQVLREGKELRDLAEHRYTVANIVFHIFYVLGFVIGITGLLIGETDSEVKSAQ